MKWSWRRMSGIGTRHEPFGIVPVVSQPLAMFGRSGDHGGCSDDFHLDYGVSGVIKWRTRRGPNMEVQAIAMCECCGRDLIDGECLSCNEDRRQGEEFAAKHGMPWERPMSLSEMEKRITDIEPILQFFAYDHLPEHLQEISRPFRDLAFELVKQLPRNPERETALRKMLEAKDCCVRAKLYR